MVNNGKHRSKLVGLFAALTLLALSPSPGFAEQPISTESGPIAAGSSEDPAVRVFKGIPYASPPVGKLRWQPPEPPVAWQGVRVANEYGPPCFQGAFPHVADTRPASEDCVTLNIWEPAKPGKAKLPVMVWIHGGAFVAGSNIAHDGTALARKGVILVAINYRLGPLGFFTHPLLTAESAHGSSGNYALLDAIAALKWVKKNISGFGGDPNNVTIFGQSAGSEMVNLLMVSPLSKGLFAKAIGESGGSLGLREPRTLHDSERLGVELADRAGARDLAALRSLSPEKLFELGGRQFEPVTEGWSYPIAEREALRRGLQHRLPMIVGSTADEGQLSATLTADQYRERAKMRFGANAAAFLEYFPAGSDEEARWSNKRSGTADAEFIEATIADEQSRVAPTYQYRFIHTPPQFYKNPGYARNLSGAYHASELSYVFANLARDYTAWTKVDQMLENGMSSYWVNFSRSGNPNGRLAVLADRQAGTRQGHAIRRQDRTGHAARRGCNTAFREALLRGRDRRKLTGTPGV